MLKSSGITNAEEIIINENHAGSLCILEMFSKSFSANIVILRKLSKEFRPETGSWNSERKVIIPATLQRRYFIVTMIT
jgi:hypothetical protein